MYKSIKEFLDDWEFESTSTLKVLENLNDQSLDFKSGSHVRTPGRLAWHITITLSEMMSKTGLNISVINENESVPDSSKEIINAYKDSSESLIKAVKREWNDESLNDEVPMYGETWRKEQVLTSLIKHQIHHRGQLTVLMRMAGLKVPGIYGPSFEEWSSLGMQPME